MKSHFNFFFATEKDLLPERRTNRMDEDKHARTRYWRGPGFCALISRYNPFLGCEYPDEEERVCNQNVSKLAHSDVCHQHRKRKWTAGHYSSDGKEWIPPQLTHWRKVLSPEEEETVKETIKAKSLLDRVNRNRRVQLDYLDEQTLSKLRPPPPKPDDMTNDDVAHYWRNPYGGETEGCI